jgi:spore germination protein YaaH
LVTDNGYKGLDLDFEELKVPEVMELAGFVEELAATLHSIDATLAVSIQAFPDDALIPAWQRIGAAADDVRLMAYGQRHKTPQAVVNPKSMRDHAIRALEAIPAEKLQLAMPTYCFIWNKQLKVSSDTWANTLSTTNHSVTRDTKSRAPSFATNGMTVWCEDAQSIKYKTEIARELGIRRFALWRIGGEDPSIWDAGIEW